LIARTDQTGAQRQRYRGRQVTRTDEVFHRHYRPEIRSRRRHFRGTRAIRVQRRWARTVPRPYQRPRHLPDGVVDRGACVARLSRRRINKRVRNGLRHLSDVTSPSMVGLVRSPNGAEHKAQFTFAVSVRSDHGQITIVIPSKSNGTVHTIETHTIRNVNVTLNLLSILIKRQRI